MSQSGRAVVLYLLWLFCAIGALPHSLPLVRSNLHHFLALLFEVSGYVLLRCEWIRAAFWRDPGCVIFGCTVLGLVAHSMYDQITDFYGTMWWGGSHCWLKSIRHDLGKAHTWLDRMAIPSTINRADFLRYVARAPSRDWLAGRIHISKDGVTSVRQKFCSRSHRRLFFGRSFLHPDALYIHNVDTNQIVSVAAAANASTMGQSEANERYKRKLSSAITLRVNLTPQQERQLKKLVPDIPFDVVGGKNNTSDHAVLGAARVLTRSIFDEMYQTIKSSLPTLVIGSTANDLDVYELNDNVDHYFHGVETKDYMRTVVPLLERFAKKLRTNLNGNSLGRSGKVSKTYLKIHALIQDYRAQAGLSQSLITDETKIERKYERLVCRDIYELGVKDVENLFKKTGANHLIGYGIYPDELQFPDVAPDPHYRFDINRAINRATLTFHGACNGYSHNLDTWGWFLRTPVVNCTDFSLVTEVTARIGPYAIYTITRHDGTAEYIPRTLTLPERKHRALIMDVPRTYLTGKLERFPVNVSEWHAVVNWASSLDEKSLNYHTVLLYIRRMLGGVSLVNKELTEPWSVKPRDAPKLALAVVLHVMRTNNVANEIIEEVTRTQSIGLLMGLIKKPTSFVESLIGYVRNNGLSNEIAVYPDNEFFSLDSTPLLRVSTEPREPAFKVNLDFTPETEVDCAFCKEIAPGIGAQVVRCLNAEKEGIVDTSMDTDELKALINELIDDDEDPAGLAKLKADVKKYVPKQGFANHSKFSYVMGGPGAGKSYLIRAIAQDPDAIYVPFTKLKVDYESVPHPVTGKERDLRFATTHRGLKLGMCKRLFIDEFTALDWRYIKLVIQLCSPDEVIIVGDTNQTGVRDGEEGVNISSVVDIAGLPRHQLMVNFRNQPDTVHWMNKLIPDYQFASFKEQQDKGKAPGPSIRMHCGVTESFVVPRGASEMFFTHNTAGQHGRSNNGKDKYTVRSFQGSTVDTAVVYLNQSDLRTAEAPGMFLVALTRAKTLTWVVHDGHPDTIAFLKERHLPALGPYVPDETPLPRHENNFARKTKPATPAAFDFVRRLDDEDGTDMPRPLDREVLSLTSYQVGIVGVALVSWFSPALASYLLALMTTGFELEYRPRNLFRFAQALFILGTVAFSHRTVSTVMRVVLPDTFLTDFIVSFADKTGSNEISFISALLGKRIGQWLLKIEPYFFKLERYLETVIAKLPVVLRAVSYEHVFAEQHVMAISGKVAVVSKFLAVDRLKEVVGLLHYLPSTFTIVSNWTYLCAFAIWILWYHRSARSVFKLSLRAGFGGAVSASVFTHTAHIVLGEGHVNAALDHFASLFVRSKDALAPYLLVATTWIPDIAVFKYVKLPDLEIGVPEGRLVSGRDAFRTADIHYGTTPFIDPLLDLTGVEQSITDTVITNGQLNRDDFSVPLDKKNKVSQPNMRYKFCSGYGYRFTRDNIAQSLKAIAGRYLNKKKPSVPVGSTAASVAAEVVKLGRQDMFLKDIVAWDESLMELAIYEAEQKASERGYDTQVSIDDFDTDKIRMFMKETFKPGPLSNLKPFDANKVGMGVSPFNKTAHVTFATAMRYINLLVLRNLKDNVVYDNRLTEEQLTEKLNRALAEVPAVAVNGVTDFKMYDSQQDAFCQHLVRELITSLGINPDFYDHYLRFCSGSTVLADGGIKGRLGHEKLSGDPATLLTNSLLGGLITNYLFRGEGPLAMAIKGDDGFKRQLNLRVDTDHAAKLDAHTRLQSVMCVEEPAEFCGKVVGTIMCQNIMRKFTSVTSKTYIDYQHYAQTCESSRDWCQKLHNLPVDDFNEVLAQNAALIAPDDPNASSVEMVRSIFDTVVSLSHLSESDFGDMFQLVETPRFHPAGPETAANPVVGGGVHPDIEFGSAKTRRVNLKKVRKPTLFKSNLAIIKEDIVYQPEPIEQVLRGSTAAFKHREKTVHPTTTVTYIVGADNKPQKKKMPNVRYGDGPKLVFDGYTWVQPPDTPGAGSSSRRKGSQASATWHLTPPKW